MFFINLDKEYRTRYDMSKFMEFDNNCYDILGSYLVHRLKSLQVSGIHVVQSGESKPDLASHIIYGKTQYWWLLMLFNDIFSVEDFKVGMALKYPTLSALEDLYFSLKSLETTSK